MIEAMADYAAVHFLARWNAFCHRPQDLDAAAAEEEVPPAGAVYY